MTNGKNSGRTVTTVRGRGMIVGTLVAGTVTFGLVPALFQRTTAIAGAFEFFRFKKLRFRQLVGSTTATLAAYADRAVGYSPVLGAATTYTSVSELVACNHFCAPDPAGFASGWSVAQTCPSDWSVVPREYLLTTPQRWFKVTADAENPAVSQGQIVMASASTADTGLVFLEVEYEAEFTGVNA